MKNDCPKEENLPLFNSINGCLGLLALFSGLCCDAKIRIQSDGSETKKQHPALSVLYVFILSWFIAGNFVKLDMDDKCSTENYYT